MAVSPKNPTLRVLHLSDLHERVMPNPASGSSSPASPETGPDERVVPDPKIVARSVRVVEHNATIARVLGAKFEKTLREIVKVKRVDLLIFTGDLANGGQPAEYERAKVRLNKILDILQLDWTRVFLVPGNHDIDRNAASELWRKVRDHADHYKSTVSGWLSLRGTPQGAPANGETLPEQRQHGYRSFLRSAGLERLLPGGQNAHPQLGYRCEFRLPDGPPVYIIGLDTAWLAGEQYETGKLLLTRAQVAIHTANHHDGEKLPGLRLALMHHPLSDLADGEEIRPLLAERVDLVLHGHQHAPQAWTHGTPDHALRFLAAGSLYEGDDGDQWVNSFHVLDVEMNEAGHPLGYNVQYFAWSPGGHWHKQSALYENALNGRLQWKTALGKKRRPATPRSAGRPGQNTPPPSIPTAALDKFVGRTAQLAALTAALLPDAGPAQAAVVCNLQGMAGVGKSLLVERFFQLHGERFPGGHLKLTLGENERPTAESLLQSIAERLGLKPTPGDLAVRVRMALEERRPLLHLDNLDTEEQAQAAAALVARLPQTPLILTGRFAFDAEAGGWRVVPVAPFAVDEALQQLTRELGEARAKGESEADKRRLVTTLAGLPLAISLAGSYLRAGPSIRTFLERHRERLLSMEAKRAPNTLYADQTRETLRSLATTFDLSIEALRALLGAEATEGMPALCALGVAPLVGAGIGWLAAIMGVEEARAEDWLSAALTLSIVQHEPETRRWRVHKLLGEHLKSLTDADADAAIARMDTWVLERLDKEPEETRGARWRELHAEHEAVAQWVAGLDGERAVTGGRVGFDYALVSGPYAAWLGAVARGLETTGDGKARSRLLLHQGTIARHSGDVQLALFAAKEMRDHGIARRLESKKMLDQRGAKDWEREVALADGLRADIHQRCGQLAEALSIWVQEVLPVFERIGDVREKAVTLGRIAGVYEAQGRLDEALRIQREEVLPVYEQLGEDRGKAITMGAIADIHETRGQLDEALRIQREEVLPVFVRLGDARNRAVTQGRIADIHQKEGRLDEALRIRRDEELPVYQRLGDIREEAVTKGKIADVLQARGEVTEALRIREEEELPVYERLRDIQGKAVVMSKIADHHEACGQLDEALRIRRTVELPLFELLGDINNLALTWARIADVLQKRGHLDEALRIRREDVLPIFKRLGNLREMAITVGKIADVFQAKGKLDEALQVRRTEELPICEQLRAPSARAVTLSQIAGILQEQGQHDEALRIHREEVLPVYYRLGDQQGLIVGQTNLAFILFNTRKPEHIPEALTLLTTALKSAHELKLSDDAEYIRGLFRQLGLPPPH